METRPERAWQARASRVVEIVQYSPEWATVFGDLKRVLEACLGKLGLAVEHVGSTAVPGLAAKPIIDLDIVIGSREQLPTVIASLSRLGYFYQGDKGVPGREAFGRGGDDVPRDGSGRRWPGHHLYVCAKDSAELGRHLAFRDFLRANPKVAAEYAMLKRRLAQEHADDRDAYSLGKSDFIARVLRLAAGEGSGAVEKW